jgi:3-phosphoshikimate 1-carboxyvinyltransferase
MGAQFIGRSHNSLLPMAVKGGDLQAINYYSPVASAQVKSAILLAGLFCQGRTVVTEPALSRDHTERMISFFGGKVEVSGRQVAVTGYPMLTGKKIMIPGDISAAAFFMVAAAIIPGSDVTITNVGLNPTRTGVLEVLQRMGARLEVGNLRQQEYEPVGDIHIEGRDLTGTVIEGEIIPRLIDEIPILAVAAAVAQGKTIFRDAAELRVKETDRINALATELTKFGVNIQTQPDGMVIEGGRPLTGTTCCSHGDHRMAMALAVIGLVAKGQTTIKEATSINVSFPGFADVLNSIMVV